MIYPDLIEKIKKEDETFLIFQNGTIVVGYEIETIDLELKNETEVENSLLNFVRSLSPKVRVRLFLDSSHSNKEIEEDSRSNSLKTLGYSKSHSYIFFELETIWLRDELKFLKTLFSKDDFLENKIQELKKEIRLNEFKSLSLKFNRLTDYFKFFVTQKISVHDRYITVNDKLVSVLKLTRQASHEVPMETLAKIKDYIPKPFKIVTTFRTHSSQKAETFLRQKSSQAQVGEDQISQSKYEMAQEDLTKISLHGNKITEVEVSVILERLSEKDLNEDLVKGKEVLRPLGNFDIETFASFEAFKSTLLGETPHVPLNEIDEVLISYFPIMTNGKSPMTFSPKKRSLTLHREDSSLDDFDLYNPKYDSFSTCIFGMPGSGKSVLTNMITRSLSNDPQIKIVKLDVGGSHTRETELLGGEEFEITLDKPCGFNPFSIFKTQPRTASPEVIQILSTFLETLLREEGETFLKKEMKSDIEKSLLKYSQNLNLENEAPSIDDFVKKMKSEIPRVKLLERWSGGGVFSNAFRESEEFKEKTSSKLKYFNFSKISQALDSDFSQGGLASVMAAFNFDILLNRNGKRFVFIADEVPVFIERCFSFFSLSIANIRKNGDAFITIAQRSEHVVVNGNTSILDNSPSKFFFTVDGNEEAFRKRTSLTEIETQKIRNLQRVQGEYSEVFYKDQIGGRVFRILLSPEEYWSYTSKMEDKIKIKNLMEYVPGLTLKEAIVCLGR